MKQRPLTKRDLHVAAFKYEMRSPIDLPSKIFLSEGFTKIFYNHSFHFFRSQLPNLV